MLTVLTDQGSGEIPFQLSAHSSLEELNAKISTMSIFSAEDFSKITQIFSSQDREFVRALQLATLNALPLTFFYPTIKQVPRPMHVILKKENGIEFLALSLDAASFDKATLANEQLQKESYRTLKNFNELSEETILEELSKIISTLNLSFDFTIQLGVNFSKQTELQKVLELGKKYKLIYIEQASVTDSQEDYAFLTEQLKTTTFVCQPYAPTHFVANATLLFFSSVQELDLITKTLKEKAVNIFYSLQEGEETLAVALALPIIKIPVKNKTIAKKLGSLKNTLKKNS